MSKEENFDNFLLWWTLSVKIFIVLVGCCGKLANREEEIIGTGPTAQNDDSAIRSENERDSRSTNMPMPPYPIGWSTTRSGANPAQSPYPTQAYPSQMPYPAQMTYPPNYAPPSYNPQSHAQGSCGHQSTAPYLSQLPTQNVSSSLNSGVKLPSAPSQEMDSPPDFEEAIKMCQNK